MFNVLFSDGLTRACQKVEQTESKSSYHDVSPGTPLRVHAKQTPSWQPVAAERSTSQEPNHDEYLPDVSLLPP